MRRHLRRKKDGFDEDYRYDTFRRRQDHRWRGGLHPPRRRSDPDHLRRVVQVSSGAGVSAPASVPLYIYYFRHSYIRPVGVRN